MIPSSVILLVDDDPDDLLMLSDAFKEISPIYETVEAYDGKAALQLLEDMLGKGTIPDLLVLDINMPVLDGRELLGIIKRDERYKEIPMIMYTTSSNPFDKLHCAQYNVDLVTKPNNTEALKQVASYMLNYCKRPAA